MSLKAFEIPTDHGDTIYVTPYSDGSFGVAAIDHETGRALELHLTEDDVERLRQAFHSEKNA